MKQEEQAEIERELALLGEEPLSEHELGRAQFLSALQDAETPSIIEERRAWRKVEERLDAEEEKSPFSFWSRSSWGILRLAAVAGVVLFVGWRMRPQNESLERPKDQFAQLGAGTGDSSDHNPDAVQQESNTADAVLALQMQAHRALHRLQQSSHIQGARLQGSERARDWIRSFDGEGDESSQL